jgi:electron transport complex protein RnfG
MKRKNNKKKSNLSERILQNKAYPVIFLVIIVFVAVSLLMVISDFTMEKIIAERNAEIIAQLETIFSEIDDYEYKDEYYEVYSGGGVAGYAFIAKGKGYGGEIEILVGVDTEFEIEKVIILSNTETPGLGTRIAEDFFTDQFTGLGINDIRLSKDGGKIDAITGATISSTAVTDAVRRTLESKIEEIKNNK